MQQGYSIRSLLLRYVIAAAAVFAVPGAHAATLVWGTGNWGDTWAATSSTGDSTGGSVTTSAPQTVTATSVSTQGAAVPASTASFSIGLTRDNGTTYQSAVTFGDRVEIAGRITPQASELGQLADIFVVARIGNQYFMRVASGAYVPWSGTVVSLQPFREDVALSENLKVDIYTGGLFVRGEIQLFLGYMTSNGVLHYTPVPVKVTSG